jgi:Na+-driven multidrug efflux pump
MWMVRLFPASILVLFFGLGLEAAWSCMVADLVVRGVLNLIRFKRGHWIDSWKG